MGNLDLHLIKGRPAVHLDDDMTVGHLAIPVPADRMSEVRERLVTHQVEFTKNVSAPNPTEDGGKIVVPKEQVKISIYTCFGLCLILFQKKYNTLLKLSTVKSTFQYHIIA